MRMMKNRVENLTNKRMLAKNSLLNVAGTFIPLLLAVFVIPVLIKSIGADRFGILTLVWVLVGYFGLFDMGLGWAVTKLVAEKIGAHQDDEIPSMVWTAQLLMVVLGTMGGLLLAILSPWFVRDVLLIPEILEIEVLRSFFIVALSIPFVVCTAGWRGMLMAYQRFGYVNAIRTTFGAFTFLGPLIVLPFYKGLVPIVIVLVVGRVIVFFAYVFLCFKVNPILLSRIQVKFVLVKRLLTFGSWMTVSNVLRPLMVYMDRFFIGAMVSTVAVAYYTTPYEIVTKLTLIPSALSAVLFPAFSTMIANDRTRVGELFGQGVKYIFLAIFPLVLVAVTLANEILTLWLDKEFADNSTLVLQILSIGILINSIAHLPSALIQGAGRPDITAKLNIIELPFYLLILWFLLEKFGILGAAVAWSVRVGIDTILMYFVTIKIFPETTRIAKHMSLSLILGLLLLFAAFFPSGIMQKVIFLVFFLSFFVTISWMLLLSMDERKQLVGIINVLLKRNERN